MKGLIILLVLGVLSMGCPASIPPPKGPPTKVRPKAKPKQAEPCKKLHIEHGSFVTIVIAECTIDAKSPKALTAAVLVRASNNGGKDAADEATRLLIKYFKGKPVLTLLSMSKVAGQPLYVFLVSGVEQGSYTPKRRLKRLRRGGAQPMPAYQLKYERQLARP